LSEQQLAQIDNALPDPDSAQRRNAAVIAAREQVAARERAIYQTRSGIAAAEVRLAELRTAAEQIEEARQTRREVEVLDGVLGPFRDVAQLTAAIDPLTKRLSSAWIFFPASSFFSPTLRPHVATSCRKRATLPREQKPGMSRYIAPHHLRRPSLRPCRRSSASGFTPSPRFAGVKVLRSFAARGLASLICRSIWSTGLSTQISLIAPIVPVPKR
jgi:hypothetical protein